MSDGQPKTIMKPETTKSESTPTTPEEEQVGQHYLVRKLREMSDVQGSNGNWNYDPYMHGMYNGMELALAMMEEREPEFKDAPDEWLVDRPTQTTVSGQPSDLPDAGLRTEYRLQFRCGDRPLENSHAGPFNSAAAAMHYYYNTTMRNQGCSATPTVVREKIEWEVVMDTPDNK